MSNPWKLAVAPAGARFTVKVNVCEAFAPTPLLALNISVYIPLVPLGGVPLSTPVAGLKFNQPGGVPLSVMEGAGLPAAVTLNVPGESIVNAAAGALVNEGTVCCDAPKNIPLTTAFPLFVLVTTIFACPDTFHTR